MTEQLKLEIRRKIFHATSIIFPLIYVYNSKVYILQLLFFFTLLVLLLDIVRNYNTKFNSFILKNFKLIIRNDEFKGGFTLSSVSYMFLGLLITAVIFPKGLCINCWLVLIISDAMASIFGIRFGFAEVIPDKTVVGSIMFFVSAIFISLLSINIIHYNTSFHIIIVSSLVATLTELFSKNFGINDNLAIPISFGLTTLLFCLGC